MNLSNIYPSLKGKHVLITGGANGIGAAMVHSFCNQGAKVCFIDIDQVAAQKVCSALKKNTAHFYYCDLTDIERLKNTVKQIIYEHGPINVLINNAAKDDRHHFQSCSEENWDKGIGNNLKHTFFCIQSVLESMKSCGGGAIVNLGSGSWHAKQQDIPIYTTSKAGIEGLTRGLARELGPYKIRINTLIPGWVMTERQLSDIVDDDAKQYINNNQCIQSELLAEDICAMALFLASDDSRMCTAQNFIVDAGWL